MSSSQEAQGRWRWLWNRLRCMSTAEVVHRIARAATAARRQRLMAEPVPAPIQVQAPRWVQVPPPEQLVAGTAPYMEEARALHAGRVRLFERERFEVGAEPDWLRCPLTGVTAPLMPARQIAITDRALVGDIKYLWELNRHLQWVTLAQAWVLDGDAAHLDLLRRQLAGWLKQNPAGRGPHYTSSLEAAIRLVNWSVTWQLLGGANGLIWRGHEALREAWLEAVYRHALQIARAYSRYSSANNHLIGELCGVYVASRTWPAWPLLTRLGDSARDELIQQIDRQVHADGVPAEQAFEYAGFIFDFLWLAERCAAANAEPMPDAYRARLRAMADFAHALGGATGGMPAVGDADGAEALRLDPRPGREPLAALLEKEAALSGRSVPPWLHPRDDVAWLGLPRPPVAVRAAATLDFDTGGYVLFEGGVLQGGMDVGPLGYLGIAAHGHADALQLWLSVQGEPLLIDPGTYAYWADKAWRDYFRGTSAHNTLELLGRDQSESGGRFMWTRHARVRLLRRERPRAGCLRVAAEHDGYGAAMLHRRELAVDCEAGRLEVQDMTPQPVEAALHWHLAPGWQCELLGDTLLARRGRWQARLRVRADAPGELALLQGQIAPPLGWSSGAYGDKQSSPVLRWRGTAARWSTFIDIESLPA